MSKPDWKDAPKWANWLAMDADGLWCWYSYKPTCGRSVWKCDAGRWSNASDDNMVDWKKTLEPRP